MKKKTNSEIFLPVTVRSIEQLASSLKRIRKLSGLSQMELAKKSGLTQAAISRIESSNNEKVSLRTLFLVFATLQADLIISPRLKESKRIIPEGLY